MGFEEINVEMKLTFYMPGCTLGFCEDNVIFFRC